MMIIDGDIMFRDYLTKNQIEKAVNWWGEVLKNPKYDNGDKSDSGGFGIVLGMLARKEITDEDIEKFKNNLRKILEQKKESCPINLALFCDYHPCKELWEATKGTNIDELNFPWKTIMQFDAIFINHRWVDRVLVSYGYGADYVEVKE